MSIDFNDALTQAELDRPKRQQQENIDPYDAVRSAMAEHGYYPKNIKLNERFRFAVTGDAGTEKSGWCIIFTDPVLTAVFGDWRSMKKIIWSVKKNLTIKDHELIEARIKKDEEDRKLKHEKSAKIANEVFLKAQPVNGQGHPYLTKKGVKAYGAIREFNNNLILPLFNAMGEIKSYSEVFPDGSKKNLYGGKKFGHWFNIPGNENIIYVCEGYATGASIHEATGYYAIAAIDAGNIKPVAIEVKKKYPNSQIIICADDDRYHPDLVGNPGIRAASEAASLINAKMITPVFVDYSSKPTDFNDLHQLEGIEAVREQLKIKESTEESLKNLFNKYAHVKSYLTEEPAPPDYILKLKGDKGFIEKGYPGGLFAPGGVGKSFSIMELCFHAAEGTPFGPFYPTRPLKVFAVFAEDPQRVVDRRLFAYKKAINKEFSENLYAISLYGRVKSFLQVDNGKNYTTTTFFEEFSNILKEQSFDMVFIDPKVKFCGGVDENDNPAGDAWIEAMSVLCRRHNITMIFTGHTGKNNGNKGGNIEISDPNELGQYISRGASSVVDGCRFAIAMGKLLSTSLYYKKLNLSQKETIVCMAIPKNNYGASNVGYYCYRVCPDTGQLYFINEIFSYNESASVFVRLLIENKIEESRDVLSKNREGLYDKLHFAMKEKYKFYTHQGRGNHGTMDDIIETAITKGWLIIENITAGKTKKTILKPNLSMMKTTNEDFDYNDKF